VYTAYHRDLRSSTLTIRKVSVSTTVYHFAQTILVPAVDEHFENSESVKIHAATSTINGKSYLFYCNNEKTTNSSSKAGQYSEVLVFGKADKTQDLLDVVSSDDIVVASLLSRYVQSC